MRRARAPPPPPRGVYLWGGVGRGKSMLMDLAFAAIPVEPSAGSISTNSCSRCTSGCAPSGEGGRRPDPAGRRGDRGRARLLAFDEMVINNSADAMILSRLFSQLLEAGVTVITTSNRPPRDLYLGGLNRELFLPFIDLIERELDVVPLNGPTDYRLERLGGLPTWYVPNGPEATEALSAAFFRLTDYPVEDRAQVPTEDIPVPGRPNPARAQEPEGRRRLLVQAAVRRGARRADYLAIARRFHTVIIVGIPVMGPENRNEAARFVTLIDALYEHKVKLLAAADAEPPRSTAGDGAFEFERTASRLIEMQSPTISPPATARPLERWKG
jgi:cell division protein ZapE